MRSINWKFKHMSCALANSNLWKKNISFIINNSIPTTLCMWSEISFSSTILREELGSTQKEILSLLPTTNPMEMQPITREAKGREEE